jgi:hypothetical protein
MHSNSRIGAACVALTAALALACGGDDGASGSPAGSTAAVDGNRAPSVLSVSLIPNPPVPGEDVRAVVRSSDPDGDAPTLSYEWTVRGRSLSETGPSVRLPSLRRGDEVRVAVTAHDGEAESEPKMTAARIGNTRPTIVDLRVSRQERDGAEHWVVDPMADDADGDDLTFEYTWRVNGRASDHDGDAFPTASLRRGDRLTVRVVAHDGEDRSAPIESAPVEVANSAPEIVSRPRGLNASGEFHYALEARDSDGDRGFRYELVQGPEGMEIDSASGELHWKPRLDQTGEHRVEVVVDDRRGGRSSQVFVLPVVAREIDEATPPAAAAR